MPSGKSSIRFGIDDLHRNARHGPADRAFLAIDRRTLRAARRHVDRHQRRELGRAVAFDRPDAELLLERVAQRDRQLLGPGDDDFERARAPPARTAADSSAGTSAWRAGSSPSASRASLATICASSGVTVVGGADIQEQRPPQRDREAERMKERHDAQHRVARPRMDDLLDRLDIRADVVMREHHALGHAGRAGGEDDRHHIVAADAVQAEHAVEHQRRHQKRIERRQPACRRAAPCRAGLPR